MRDNAADTSSAHTHADAAMTARSHALAPWLAHPQAIRAIFFDAGFTLLHPNPSIASIVQRSCAQAGITLELADLEQQMPLAEQYFASAAHVEKRTWADHDAINVAWEAYFTTLIAPFMPTDDPTMLPRCIAHILTEFDSHAAWRLYDDVRPTLDVLRHRYTLGVISDWNINLGPILRAHDLIDDFSFLVVSATSRHAKPDLHLFDLALHRGDALGEYTLYVGDSYVQDVLGARAAGINPVLLDRRQRLDPMAVDCPVIHSLSDLLTLLEISDS